MTGRYSRVWTPDSVSSCLNPSSTSPYTSRVPRGGHARPRVNGGVLQVPVPVENLPDLIPPGVVNLRSFPKTFRLSWGNLDHRFLTTAPRVPCPTTLTVGQEGRQGEDSRPVSRHAPRRPRTGGDSHRPRLRTSLPPFILSVRLCVNRTGNGSVADTVCPLVVGQSFLVL